ncbi:MAG: flagellar biosynthesis protein FlhB, partial [Litoricola sp.]|nr:flagellar biosynthesis protein FlhB [Litorivicinus sp.]
MRLKSKKAVALEYGQQESPILIAKGDDELAL